MAKKHLIVEVNELSVLIVKDGPGYYAQGIEIDYAASGDSVEDAQQRFETGFFATVSANLKRYSDLSRFLKPAPEEIQREFNERVEDKFTFSSVSVHHIIENKLGATAKDSNVARMFGSLKAFKYFAAEGETPCHAAAHR